MIPDNKICVICNINKDKSKFSIRLKPNGYSWLRAECKSCQNDRRNYRYHNIPEVKQKHLNNNKKYALTRKEDKREYDRNREIKIKDRRRVQKLKKYHERKQDPIFRLKRSLRARLYFALRGGIKCGGTMSLVGCTIEELKVHLENKFLEGMSWDNYGKDGWEVDHIIPCSKFDLSNPNEQKRCMNYNNLQPLWYYENARKGDSIIWL